MKVSIVIAVEQVNDYVRENIEHCLSMDFKDFEILLMLANSTEETFPKTKIIVRPDLAFNPAQRRDLAITEAEGEILAFIDDDAYPSTTWLSKAINYFNDLTIAAVGGPGVNPPQDSLRQQVSGWSSASPFGGGPGAFYRFIPGKTREVNDYASMNLIVRRSDFSMVGGFDSNYWPGEDTKLCLDLTDKIGKKIIYDPAILVYHHRRPIFVKHLKQNGNYGLHRGYFARVLPKTSRKMVYFLPSLFVLGLVLTPLFLVILKIINLKSIIDNLFFPILKTYLLVLSTYLLLVVFNALWVFKKSKSAKVSALTIPTVFVTHAWYGVQFIRGFLAKKIKR